MKSEYVMHGQVMKFVTPEPDPKDICNLCGGHVGKDNLIQGQVANICFDCADLAKQLADEKRKEIAEKEIQQMAKDLSLANITTDKGNVDIADTGMATAYMYAERLYKAGYRKSAPEIKQIQEG
ncbi:hypothetical protein ABM000_02830 [Morganella morganii]|uniref:hypothetical protein n=1 Tax=Morganella morganii TaxID=582 RepID=UPI000CE2AECB|nr:hypothetical protein [Morganella morganii]AVD59137.1 hypothetical protein C4E49_06805 [Morganella morganii]MBT0429216.1 hypothetical protein [Morganella morganii subsp. morganii]MBT0437228.1 hypothetical protein [Morganella morganii subsp. morganii]MBT0523953.1 hypothetical protein [Morganella morganii subsp. morganii]MCW3199180.1 hypothetical protein [Morganella morganii]